MLWNNFWSGGNKMLKETISKSVQYFSNGRIANLLSESIKYPLREIKIKNQLAKTYGDRDMFSSITIENISLCNRKCWYCPNSNQEMYDQRPKQEIDLKIYSSIIDQLSEIPFQGELNFSHYGEPLIDKNLETKVKKAREKLPKATITVFTNGDYLTLERFENLMNSGVNQLLVTNHNPDERFSENLSKLNKFISENPDLKKYVNYNKMVSYSNRGGLIDLKEYKKRKFYKCQKTHELHINVVGDVIICANDYLGQNVFGNLHQQSLLDIWNNEEFKSIREKHGQGIYDLDMCKKCL